MLDQLRERHPLELPQGVVEQEVEGLLREYAEALARRGRRRRERRGSTGSGSADEVQPQAEQRVHARLLLDAIAEAEGVAVGEDEFERALAAIARAAGTHRRRRCARRSTRTAACEPCAPSCAARRRCGRLLGEDSPAAGRPRGRTAMSDDHDQGER